MKFYISLAILAILSVVLIEAAEKDTIKCHEKFFNSKRKSINKKCKIERSWPIDNRLFLFLFYKYNLDQQVEKIHTILSYKVTIKSKCFSNLYLVFCKS